MHFRHAIGHVKWVQYCLFFSENVQKIALKNVIWTPLIFQNNLSIHTVHLWRKIICSFKLKFLFDFWIKSLKNLNWNFPQFSKHRIHTHKNNLDSYLVQDHFHIHTPTYLPIIHDIAIKIRTRFGNMYCWYFNPFDM